MLEYDPLRDKAADGWSGDADTRRYASDNEWSGEYAYYTASDEYKEGSSFWCVSFYEGKTLSAVAMLLGGGDILTINPLIVAPEERRRGIAKSAIKMIVSKAKTLDSGIKALEAGIDISNAASIRAFEACGFKRDRLHPDGDFAFYKLIL